MQLSGGYDLVQLTNKAQYRHNWKKAVEKIRAAEESKWRGKETERLATKAAKEAAAALERSRAAAALTRSRAAEAAAAVAERPRTLSQTTLMRYFGNTNLS